MSADAVAIAQLLRACDAGFVPPLSTRVDLDAYAAKLAAQATLVEAWDGQRLAGLVALYCNDHATGIAYISNVSVAPDHARRGIASRLLGQALDLARAAGMRHAALRVHGANVAALALYRRHGFTPIDRAGADLQMQRALTSEDLS